MASKPTGNPVGRPRIYEKRFAEMLLEHMRGGASFESFAAIVGVCFDTLYAWAREFPEFSLAKKMGKAHEMIWWETLARGGAGGKVKDFNATMTIFSLKNKFSRQYRDSLKIEAEFTLDNTQEKIQNALKDPDVRKAAMLLAETVAAAKHGDDEDSGSQE